MYEKSSCPAEPAQQLKAATDYIVRCLARREFSQHELMQRLLKRGISEAIAIDALAQASAANWQSDERYAAAFARSRVERRQGPIKIRAELRARGLSDADVAQALTELEADWLELALAFVERNKRYHTEPHKARQALLRRGFSAEQASQAWREWERRQRESEA